MTNTQDRRLLVKSLREVDKKPFSEIGRILGVGVERARQIYKKIKSDEDAAIAGESENPFYGLSVRAANVCGNLDLLNREQIKEAVIDGRLSPFGKNKPRNYGIHAHFEVCDWLGVPRKRGKHVLCPHCHKVI